MEPNNKESNVITKTFNKAVFVKPFQNKSDVVKGYSWIVFCLIFLALGLASGIFMMIMAIKQNGLNLMYIFSAFYCIPGAFSIIPFFKIAFISTWKNSRKIGADIGSQCKEEHVTVTNEYNNTYKVSKHTSNMSFEFAYIGLLLGWAGWCCMFVYGDIIMSVVRIKNILKEIKNYKNTPVSN